MNEKHRQLLIGDLSMRGMALYMMACRHLPVFIDKMWCLLVWHRRRQTREPIHPELTSTGHRNTFATMSTSNGGRQNHPPCMTGGVPNATRHPRRNGSIPATAHSMESCIPSLEGDGTDRVPPLTWRSTSGIRRVLQVWKRRTHTP